MTQFIADNHLRLDLLMQLSHKPPLFEPGEELFWNDKHISEQMLAAHLDAKTDAASRAPQAIDRTVNWLLDYLKLKPGDKVIDLGCGPGLYCVRLAQAGLRVTGIDYSSRSIAYAKQYAAAQNLAIEYNDQDYLTLDRPAEFDAAFLIYGDFCVSPPDKRDILLRNIYRALKPGGFFIFDVTTRYVRLRSQLRTGWYAAESGFWKPGNHLVLERQFDYPDEDVVVDQYIVIEEDGTFSVYRNWFQNYTLESLLPILEHQGFVVRDTWSDLTGTTYTPYSEWIGLAVQKV